MQENTPTSLQLQYSTQDSALEYWARRGPSLRLWTGMSGKDFWEEWRAETIPRELLGVDQAKKKKKRHQ